MRTSNLLLAAALLAPAAASAAAPECLPREAIIQALARDFAEAPIGMGLQSDSAVVEIFRSEDGQSWTILQSFSNGISCVVAVGTNWVGSTQVDLAGIPS